MPQPPNEAKKNSFEEKKLSELKIPISVLSNRSLATLEAVVVYMKDELKLTYHQIAELLNRDDRTVWTCYSRASKKRKADFKDRGILSRRGKDRENE